MKKLFLVLAISVLLVGCGNDSVDNEHVGRVKQWQNMTPLICPNYSVIIFSSAVEHDDSDGSYHITFVSMYVVVPDYLANDVKAAMLSGDVVKIKYDTRRFTQCSPDRVMNSITTVK